MLNCLIIHFVFYFSLIDTTMLFHHFYFLFSPGVSGVTIGTCYRNLREHPGTGRKIMGYSVAGGDTFWLYYNRFIVLFKKSFCFMKIYLLGKKFAWLKIFLKYILFLFFLNTLQRCFNKIASMSIKQFNFTSNSLAFSF